MGVYWIMQATTNLERVRDLAKSKILELQPFAGEEMTLPQTDLHRAGFIDGERAFAAQILTLLEGESDLMASANPMEEEMVMSLGQT